jgi:hypothetical protein
MGMMQRGALTCGATLVVLGLAACGGSGGGSHVYTLAATQSCLKKAAYQVTTVTNSSLPGSAGNLRVRLTNTVHLLNPNSQTGGGPEQEYVFLVFQKDPAAALVTENKAVTLAVQSTEHYAVMMTRAAAKAGVGLTKNVFYYSTSGALTQGERTKVMSCLR